MECIYISKNEAMPGLIKKGIDVFCSVFGQNNWFSTIDINAGVDTGDVSAAGMVFATSNQKDLKKMPKHSKLFPVEVYTGDNRRLCLI